MYNGAVVFEQSHDLARNGGTAKRVKIALGSLPGGQGRLDSVRPGQLGIEGEGSVNLDRLAPEAAVATGIETPDLVVEIQG